MTDLNIYCDGACSFNPGPGGWGVVLLWGGKEKHLSGFESETTNNRMELTAAIKALEAVKRDVPINIFTDSRYVEQGITKWIIGWKANNWKGNKVLNRDLWERLDTLNQYYKVTWHWVKGHNGDHYNEVADGLATQAIEDNK